MVHGQQTRISSLGGSSPPISSKLVLWRQAKEGYIWNPAPAFFLKKALVAAILINNIVRDTGHANDEPFSHARSVRPFAKSVGTRSLNPTLLGGGKPTLISTVKSILLVNSDVNKRRDESILGQEDEVWVLFSAGESGCDMVIKTTAGHSDVDEGRAHCAMQCD
ncbi:uncharacterized protein PV06_06412 [Exophiala oligosperma]|uniref:Uncharacterized protein n=1 Tax=Exophiala oligosperma TaxID=215243 RepID=A0A0D2DKI0_9EURO|nr:uncharacterized protein PV06_06412 [Exophiala oligosperma]KIW42910.1 hypothetical protein PV06_06412 [Exophiala oligosperma]